MSKAQDQNATRVGRAFRGKDGTIRWITSLSTRQYYTMAWLDEAKNIWWYGGKIKAGEWGASLYDGDEVPAPQPGEMYKRAGVFGAVQEYRV